MSTRLLIHLVAIYLIGNIEFSRHSLNISPSLGNTGAKIVSKFSFSSITESKYREISIF